MQNCNNLVTPWYSLFKGKQSMGWGIQCLSTGALFLRDVGQEWVLQHVQSGNAEPAWMPEVVYLTLSRKIKGQGSKCRAWSWWHLGIGWLNVLHFWSFTGAGKVSWLTCTLAGSASILGLEMYFNMSQNVCMSLGLEMPTDSGREEKEEMVTEIEKQLHRRSSVR